MILVRSAYRTYRLRWHNGVWLDEAGHRWTMDAKFNLHSKEHGFVSVSAWSIPLDDKLSEFAL